MRQFLVLILGAVAYAAAFVVHGEPGQSVPIPEKVSGNILKRYPKARDMSGKQETHFGRTLLEVSFKDEMGQEVLELFTDKHHLFGNELKVEDLSDILPPVADVLKKEFPQHELQRVELIANPNGAGEEYEIYLRSGDASWRVSINDDGAIADKLKLTP